MKRFFFLMIALCMLFTVLLTGAVGMGRYVFPQEPMAFPEFGLCAGKPCYLGIIPGETSLEDAVVILKENNINFESKTAIPSVELLAQESIKNGTISIQVNFMDSIFITTAYSGKF